MKTYSLSATSRATGRAGRNRLDDKTLYGVVYGHGFDSKPIAVDKQAFRKLLAEAGTSHIIALKIDDNDPVDVLVKDISDHPVTNDVRHFDLYAIKKGEKITAEIPVNLVGDAPAARAGNIVHQLIDSLDIRTLPADLPESFEVDISGLSEVGDSIAVRDLNLSEAHEVDEDMLDQPIVKVDAPREIEEEPEAEEVVDAADVPSEHGDDDESDDADKDGAEAKPEN